jgi:hypothetical protein
MKFFYVHFPKAGGTSLGSQLDQHFPGQVLADYTHDPIGGTDIKIHGWPEENIVGVRGHLHPSRYVKWCDVLFTLLREPVENLISIYFFWMTLPPSGPVHTKFIEERPSVLEFATRYPLRTLMSEAYFGEFDMALFDFVGFHDVRQESFEKISDLIGVSLMHDLCLNKTDMVHDEARHAIVSDPEIMGSLRDVLKADVIFYENMRGKWL